MRFCATLLILATVAACAPQTRDQVARNAARSTVNRVVLDRYPNLPLEAAIDCVIDNASANQIYSLGADTLTGPTASSVQIVAEVVQRPETVRCLATQYARDAGAL
ncbi:hypothetical protein [Roseivivax sediminis]|uniref:Succinate dehydrogenase n=1 Tax=Roseivivax sediminis TaxID=936889 RepID=A0A1I1ZFA0_9RHOB|nr:hypothetical protein [Roseivivax sediminis]SFE30379.1 hypothetical protein SAMN04515678_108121 [Roseivivax sediminis]